MKFKGIIRNVGETVIGAEALAIGGESLVRQQSLSQKKRELAAFSSWKLLRNPKETLRSPKEKSDGSATILSQIFQTYYFNWY